MLDRKNSARCTDPVALNLWHPVGAVVELSPGIVYETCLLEERLSYAVTTDGEPRTWRAAPELPAGSRLPPEAPAGALPVRVEFGLIWTSYGAPSDELFPFDEYHEPDRHNVWAGSIGVHTSVPRAVENFLDMGHFPYVHPGYLGIEPHTEVKEYDVDMARDGREIVATRCEFFQPMGALNATGGMLMEYTYRVPHPYCAILFKSSPIDESRNDAIALFGQPIDQENTRAHMMLSLLDDDNDDRLIKRFQLLIFAQDKPILENQHPRRLPLGPRVETPLRSDKTSITYRRWLSEMGLGYGVVSTAAGR